MDTPLRSRALTDRDPSCHTRIIALCVSDALAVFRHTSTVRMLFQTLLRDLQAQQEQEWGDRPLGEGKGSAALPSCGAPSNCFHSYPFHTGTLPPLLFSSPRLSVTPAPVISSSVTYCLPSSAFIIINKQHDSSLAIHVYILSTFVRRTAAATTYTTQPAANRRGPLCLM